MNSQDARLALVRIAESQLGVREIGGNNVGPTIRMYQEATKERPGAWPWCAAFVAWCVREWVNTQNPQAIVSAGGFIQDPFEIRRMLRLEDSFAVENWRCKSALAFAWENWARGHGYQVLSDLAVPRMGDIVTYDFSHIGIVTRDIMGGFQAIEGNTNADGGRDGDGVHRKNRKQSLARAFIRIFP